MSAILLAILLPILAPTFTEKRSWNPAMIRDSLHSLEAVLNRLNERTGFDGSAVVDWVAKPTRSVPKVDLRVRAMAWHDG